MNSAIQSFAAGLPDFLMYTGMAAVMLVGGIILYIIITPQKEIELLREGNTSSGVALAGGIVGLALPMASCLGSSVSPFDLVIWGALALLIQIMAFRIVDLLLQGLPKRIENDEMGAAILLVAVKLASAMLVAAALWDPNAGRF